MSWFQFGIKDLIDVLLVTILMYQVQKSLRSSGSKTLFYGLLAFLVISMVVSFLKMRLLGSILDFVSTGGVVLVVILFQDDIKRFLTLLGSRGRWSHLFKVFLKGERDSSQVTAEAAAITLACLNMSRKKSGALIVIKQKDGLEQYEHTGERIDAAVNARLIENIFFKNSPLHDGAMIISGKRIVSAGSILPVSHSSDIPKEMGLRHRSGLGMATATDAKVIIISEERGKISIAHKGELTPNISTEELQRFLQQK
ncbi:MAG: diadenylate cyclase CdaA [Porphyromonas sp.]|nr:diadenylate cyclase CdaA [Porphyromonas sp.]